MPAPLLLTSFQTWTPAQRSNSSDDLLLQVMARDRDSGQFVYLRQLPVDFDQAPQQVIQQIEQVQPRTVICCGMAESRQRLSLESRGTDRWQRDRVLHTRLDLDGLVAGLSATEISHDAGNFVCNHTYYSVLAYLQDAAPEIDCVFVHVPVLTPTNSALILEDFWAILHSLAHCASPVFSNPVSPQQ